MKLKIVATSLILIFAFTLTYFLIPIGESQNNNLKYTMRGKTGEEKIEMYNAKKIRNGLYEILNKQK